MTASMSCRTRRFRAFTLAELLVVISIVVVLATLSVLAVGAIARDARVSSGKNTVVAALEQARAYAMRHNKLVLVSFRVQWEPESPRRQFTQIWFSEYRDSDLTPSGNFVNDRYVPIEDLPVRDLSPGIKVAGPWYDNTFQGTNRDAIWVSQPEFRAIEQENEADTVGRFFGILYGAGGDLRTQTSESGASNIYVDYDLDGSQDLSQDYWTYGHWLDESSINPVPFIAVFDDDAVRERRTSNWANENAYRSEFSSLVTQYADRIHFNRYSGVVLR